MNEQQLHELGLVAAGKYGDYLSQMLIEGKISFLQEKLAAKSFGIEISSAYVGAINNIKVDDKPKITP